MLGSLLHRLTFVLTVAVLCAPLVARAKPAADDAVLTTATREWKALSADLRHRELRDRWERVIARLEKLGHSKASANVRAQALFRAGGAAEEMSTISHIKRDVLRAEALYLEAAKVSPSVKADALSAAAQIEQERLGNPEKARVTRAQLKGLAKNETPAVKKASDEPAQLQAATEAWQRLEDDGSKRKLREPWLAVIAKLEAAGEALAPDQAGALGYYRAAQAAEKLYKQSRLKADLKRAVSLYEAVAARCPKSALADDALVAAATITRTQLHETESARKDLTQAVALNGDRVADARRQLGLLPPPPKEPEEPDTASDIVAALEYQPAPQQELPPPPQEVEAVQNANAPELKRLKKVVLADTSISLSEQAGLKVKRIIIDAGHGGKDVGATGPSGIHEKDVTLAIALKLAAALKARGFDVVLTREEDAFVALEERTAIANKEHGDLFISIHANAHPSHKENGVETYALNVASNRFAMRLAARENATSTRSVSELQFLLADLATRANTIDSDRLATYVQHSIVTGVSKKVAHPKDHGVKHALFYVLLGTRMPAVLVETAFISNPTEEKRLASPAYQSLLADSIAKGVDQFVARRQQIASADQ